MPGFIVGVLVLAGLEVATSSEGAAQRVAFIPTVFAKMVRRFLDPDLALVPNWHDSSDGAPPMRNTASSSPGAPAGPAKPDPSLSRLLVPPTKATAPAPSAPTLASILSPTG